MRPSFWACLLVYVIQSDASNFHHLFNGSVKTAEVFSACRGEVGRTAAATLDELGCFAHDVSGMELALCQEVFADHDREERFVVVVASEHAEGVFRQCARNLEGEVFHHVGSDVHRDVALHEVYAVDFLC